MTKRQSWQERYWDRFYRHKPGWVDGTTEFWNMISAHAKQGGRALELGCGAANTTSRFLKEKYRTVEGLEAADPLPANEHMDQVHRSENGRWPLADGSFDTVVASYVLEHLEDPAATLAEATRVLKPGGVFIYRTPNLWHYVTLGALLSPHWVHRLLANRLRGLPEMAEEPHRAFYRVNTRRAVSQVCRRCGLVEIETRLIERDPSYGRSSRLLFFAFMAYERVVNCTDLLAGVRANLLGVWRKAGAP